MADFVKIHKKNVRFSVNRNERILLKVSSTEKKVWLSLVNVLQERRNTGPQIETVLYLFRKYLPLIGPTVKPKRNDWKTVNRNTFILFKVSKTENELWLSLVEKYCSSKVETFMHIVDKEYTFQDSLEIINEKD